MGFTRVNGVYGTVATQSNSGTTSVVLGTGQGAAFASATTANPIRCAVIDTATNPETLKFLLDVTGRSTDTLTVSNRGVTDGNVSFADANILVGYTIAAVTTVGVLDGSYALLLVPTAAKTGAYTAVRGDLVPVDTTSGAVTVTLPTSPTTGDRVGVYKYDSSANVVTVAGTIDGQTNATIVTQYAGATLEYVGGTAGWKVVAVYSSTGPTGPTGLTGPQGNPGTNGVQAYHSQGKIGNWYISSSSVYAAFGSLALSTGTLILGTPLIAQEAITIDQLGIYLTANAGAGGIVRIGLFQVSGTNPYDVTFGSAWATLLQEAPTINTTTGAGGQKTTTLTTPQVISAGTAFCVGVVPQVAGCSVNVETTAQNAGPWGCSGSILNGANIAIVQTGVTSTLGTFTPSAFFTANKGTAGWFHRSA